MGTSASHADHSFKAGSNLNAPDEAEIPKLNERPRGISEDLEEPTSASHDFLRNEGTPQRAATRPNRNFWIVLSCGASVGLLGGLIGLGGAEFRLPLLISLFSFVALEAVILNKATSLVVVAVSLPFRAASVPFASIAERWDVLALLLPGTLVGAWLGAGLATRLRSRTLYRVFAVLLVVIAAVLVFGHARGESDGLSGPALPVLAIVAGLGIGMVAALMGVAGGELLIPTITFLFGVDLKLAGSLSLAVSLPTMVVAFARYSRDRSFAVLGANRGFLSTLAAGSIVGAFLGGRLLGIVPESVLLPVLALVLIASAFKVWRHS
ncbi:MAG: sulfite exporter TauE/SafE family protein [Planctomycetota bacterium]